MEIKVATRCLDDLGRIVLPAELRAKLDLQKGDCIDIYRTQNGILLCKNQELPSCNSCRRTEDALTKVGNIFLCWDCIEKIKAL